MLQIISNSFVKRLFTGFLIPCFLLFSISGCGISDEDQKVLSEIVAKKFTDRELASITDIIKDHKDYSGIVNGKYEWVYEKGSEGVHIAKYCYVGTYPFWKRALGALIGVVTFVVSAGSFTYFPWILEENGLCLTYNVNIKTGEVLTKKD